MRQSVITHKITDSKVLSHKKAHKDAHSKETREAENKKPERIMNIFPFQTWQISSENEKRGEENLVRRLEW